MDLIDYLHLKELLKDYNHDHQREREFALGHDELIDSPMKLLKMWKNEYLHKIGEKSRVIDRFLQLLNLGDFIVVLVAIILGFTTGVGLLSYSGKEPVNVIYFLFFGFFLPLLSGFLTIFSIIKANNPREFKLLHSSPAFWIEKMVYKFFDKEKSIDVSSLALSPQILNWRLIELSLKFSLSFYTALAFALLFMVVGEDIAFGWRSTLNLSNDEFYSIIKGISLPWSFWGEAVPSKELIESSHYYRLGGVNSNLIKNASLLGGWWKFLFMSVVIYGIIFRLVLLIFAKIGYKKALKGTISNIDGVNRLLKNMTTPFISTQTDVKENPLTYSNLPKPIETQEEKTIFKNIVGWGMTQSQIQLFCERFDFFGDKIYIAGGNCTIDEDIDTVKKVEKDILIFIKSWEAPTMDFVDFVEELNLKNVKVIIFFVGLESKNFVAKDEDKKIWQDKLLSCNLQFLVGDEL